jgi:hypothetical protein
VILILRSENRMKFVYHLILSAVGEYQTLEFFLFECCLPFLIIDRYADTVCLDVVLDESSQNEICCFSVHLVH